MKKPSVAIIFLTVLIDLVGFGLILPLIPIYSENFHASGFVIGAIISAYSLMQFIFAPIWGRLSDRVGRRPVLLASTSCACLSYVIFAVGSGLTNTTAALAVMFASRLFAGICGANITVAQAYIADITPPEKRSAKMGLVGMAFGLGFIIGPVLGALSSKRWGITAPGWTAACLCAVNFSWAFFGLAESWKPSEHTVTQRPHLEQWMHTLRTPRLNLLITIFFLATFCFTCFEATIGLLVMKNFHIDTKKSLVTVSWLIAYCGFVGALVQGGGTGRLVKKMGEPKLIVASLFLAAVGIALLPFMLTWKGLFIGLGIFSIGSSMTRPPVFGMISMLAPVHEQGATMGVTQGVGSLARIVGPIFAATLFETHASLPYLICGALCFATSLLAMRYLKIKAPFAAAMERFDAENARDPNVEDGRPRELLYADRLTAWLLKLAPEASECLRLAARCQHLCRWTIPRETYPMTKPGYLRWRQDLKSFHAQKAGEILRELGADDALIQKVRDLNLKKNFPADPESRHLEDALCLVFLEFQLAALARKTDEAKLINAVQKTWKKMTPAAHAHALALPFATHEKQLIQRALQ